MSVSAAHPAAAFKQSRKPKSLIVECKVSFDALVYTGVALRPKARLFVKHNAEAINNRGRDASLFQRL